MKDATEAMLHLLFDATAAIDGAQLTLFEREHPRAPAALRSWCELRRHRIAESKFPVSKIGEVTVLQTGTGSSFSISVQTWAWPPRTGAAALTKET